MVSLTAIEEVLMQEWPGAAEEGPPLAVTAIEREEGARPELHVFTIKAIELDDANALLSRRGFPNLVKLTRIHRIKALPLLGSGKTDVQALGRMLREC